MLNIMPLGWPYNSHSPENSLLRPVCLPVNPLPIITVTSVEPKRLKDLQQLFGLKFETAIFVLYSFF